MIKPIRQFNDANRNLSTRFANAQRVRNLALAQGRKTIITMSGDIIAKKKKG